MRGKDCEYSILIKLRWLYTLDRKIAETKSIICSYFFQNYETFLLFVVVDKTIANIQLCTMIMYVESNYRNQIYNLLFFSQNSNSNSNLKLQLTHREAFYEAFLLTVDKDRGKSYEPQRWIFILIKILKNNLNDQIKNYLTLSTTPLVCKIINTNLVSPFQTCANTAYKTCTFTYENIVRRETKRERKTTDFLKKKEKGKASCADEIAHERFQSRPSTVSLPPIICDTLGQPWIEISKEEVSRPIRACAWCGQSAG